MAVSGAGSHLLIPYKRKTTFIFMPCIILSVVLYFFEIDICYFILGFSGLF